MWYIYIYTCKCCIKQYIVHVINEQKTCVYAIRMAMHETLHAVHLRIY
jgi:hypothetical protein